MAQGKPRGSSLSGELAEEILALERTLTELQSTEHEHDSAVATLAAEIEGRKAELEAMEGRLALTRNARAAHEQRLQERRASLQAALAEDAQQAFQAAMTARDAAGREVGELAEALLARLDALERTRDAAREAFATAAARAAEAGTPLDAGRAEIGAVPDVMRPAWDELLVRIRTYIDAQFEDDLVDAAARSPLGHAIGDLPAHLRELAKNRRNALAKEKRQRAST